MDPCALSFRRSITGLKHHSQLDIVIGAPVQALVLCRAAKVKKNGLGLGLGLFLSTFEE